VELSDLGREQLDHAVKALKGQPIDAVYSSDLKRAMYGGNSLAKELGQELRLEPNFREVNFGECERLTFPMIKEKFPELASYILYPESGKFQFPGGESADTFRERIRGALASLRERHAEGCVALFCHSGVCRVLLAEALNLSNIEMWNFDIDFASLNVIDFFAGGAIRVKLVNGYLGPNGYNQPGPGFDRLTYNPQKLTY
jgi:broad specificity phosphatase PhoE